MEEEEEEEEEGAGWGGWMTGAEEAEGEVGRAVVDWRFLWLTEMIGMAKGLRGGVEEGVWVGVAEEGEEGEVVEAGGWSGMVDTRGRAAFDG